MPQPPPRDPLLHSINDTCRMLSIGRSTLNKLVDQGDLHQVKIGRRSLITADSITTYLETISR